MKMPNTSAERIDTLTYISDQIYPILEQTVGREIQARRIMRLGIAAAAIGMRGGLTPDQAGSHFDVRLSHVLQPVDFDAYEPWRTVARTPIHNVRVPASLGNLANRYADTLRGTHLTDLTREPDAVHALHLAALAVPYARAHYPDLQPGKVALYSLIHDLPEAYTGDVQTFAISNHDLELKKREDAAAIVQFGAEHGDQWPELVAVVEAYETIADDEAAYVKSQDKNDPGYTHFRNDAYALREYHGVKSPAAFREQAEHNTLRTLGYASRFPLVLEDKYELTHRIAQLIEQYENPTSEGNRVNIC